jgi:hypothetical protein
VTPYLFFLFRLKNLDKIYRKSHTLPKKFVNVHLSGSNFSLHKLKIIYDLKIKIKRLQNNVFL